MRIRIIITIGLQYEITRIKIWHRTGNEEDKTLNMLISVAICTYNRASFLGRVLDSIKAQYLPQEMLEVMVVDYISTDNTRESIKEYESKISKFM